MTLFFQQWYGELLKLFARRRTYLGFGVFVALESFLLWRIHVSGLGPLQRALLGSGSELGSFFSALTVAVQIVTMSVFLLGSLFMTLVAGDIVAKESEDGHLRLLLARPVGRFRLLLLKYFTTQFYAVFLIQFLAWSAFLLGVILCGWGGKFFFWMLDGDFVAFYNWEEGIERYAIGMFAMGLSQTAISSIAFFLSCFRIKPAAATIGALAYLLADFIVGINGVMQNYKHLLITHHMSVWRRLFAETIDWPLIWRGYAVILAVNVTLFTLGYAVFESRDLKS